MGSRPSAEMHCIICNGPVDLQTDLNTNENGMAVHEGCYAKSICARNSSNGRDEDFDLLARVGLGDQSVMGLLYDRHSTMVYSVALRVCRDSALAVRYKRQQQALLGRAKAAAAAAMANKLATHINNPLQNLINIAHLAAEGHSDHNARTLGQELSSDLRRLSALVTESLELHGDSPRRN